MEQQKKLPLADGCCRRYENSSRASFDQLPIGPDVGNVGYLRPCILLPTLFWNRTSPTLPLPKLWVTPQFQSKYCSAMPLYRNVITLLKNLALTISVIEHAQEISLSLMHYKNNQPHNGLMIIYNWKLANEEERATTKA